MAFGIEIVEQPIRMIMESDFWQIILAIATIIVAGTAVAGFIKSNRTTQHQLELTRTEFRHKTRPILARHIHHKRIVNTDDIRQVDGDTYTFVTEKILFHFINNGSTSAVNIRKTTYVEIKENDFQKPILDPYSEIDSKRLVDMAPTEYYSIDVEWNTIHYEEAINGQHCYFGLVIWYDDDEKNQYYYHMEGHFDRTMLMLNYVRTGILKENP